MRAHGIGWRTASAVAIASAALGAAVASGVGAGFPATSAPGQPLIHAHLLPYVDPVHMVRPMKVAPIPHLPDHRLHPRQR